MTLPDMRIRSTTTVIKQSKIEGKKFTKGAGGWLLTSSGMDGVIRK
jgi:hypothetical protein